MDIQLSNTLTGQKETFTPIDPAHVRVYACGPTVYNYAHIGNARMAVVFDLLSRVLRTRYPHVTYVSNITDVDDKIITASKQTGEPIDAITKKYADIYNDDMASLGVKRPDIQPRATAHIGDMIRLIETLVEKDHAYVTEQGEVLFHVPSFPAYGGLSHRSRDEQIAGARVEISSHKKDPADFVLWKPSKDDEPGWESPFGPNNGRGRPGWHIECSAMAEEHLGLPFDIHGGGADLKFPHHENEIAQSCCAHGHTHDLSAFAKYWVHNGFVTVNGEKMSKSIGNITLVHDLLNTYKGEVLRLTLLSGHYKQPLDWSEEKLNQNKNMLDGLYQKLKDLDDVPDYDGPVENTEFLAPLYDDLNTPKALSILNAMARSAAKSKDPAMKAGLLQAGKVFGILQQDPDEWLGYHHGAESDIDPQKIESLLQERQEARAAKNYARADEIRDIFTDMGIVIEDTADGPKWKKA